MPSVYFLLFFSISRYLLSCCRPIKKADSTTAFVDFGFLFGGARMDVKDLRYFVAVYEAKGFSNASKSLGTVQSNVSTRIRCLEDFLGTLLFERRYRGVVPTEKGEKLYIHAKQVIATFDHTERAIRPPV